MVKVELDFLLVNHKELSKLFYDHMCDKISNPEIVREVKLIQESNDRYVFKLYYLDDNGYSFKDITHSIYIVSTEELSFTDIAKIPNYMESLVKKTNSFIVSKNRDSVINDVLE